ncbi:MAG: hypothetical protein KC561_20140, partial [Myxococcales bacterium]|nr:hypothetical protein [Myxococcales bacterium]
MLLNGDPRNVVYRDELFYLERALSVGGEENGAIRTEVTTVEGFSGDLSDFDVVVLANVGNVSATFASELGAFVRQGGGLLITMGSMIDPAEYNRVLGDLLPKPLRSVRELCEPGDPDANLMATRLARVESSHPVFRVFDLPGGDSIQSVSVYSYMLLEPSLAGQAQIIASYADGGPALVEKDYGAGRVALLTTTIDRDWSDLPIRTAFLPLARRLVRHLARRGSFSESDVVRVGQRMNIDVEAQHPDRVIIEGPLSDPEPPRYVLIPERDRVSVPFEPEQAGHYDVRLDIGGQERSFDELAFSANVDTDESDLSLTDSTLAQGLARVGTGE